MTFEFESKVYDGNIDMCWGFNKNISKPKGQVYIWRNYTHYLTKKVHDDIEYNDKLYDIVSYENLGMENYDYWNERLDEPIIGNKNNTKLFNVSFQNGTKNTTIAFKNWNQFGDGDDYDISGNLTTLVEMGYTKKYFDWKSIDVDYDVKNFYFKGMNKWYIIRNQSINQGQRYLIRVWIDVKFNGFDGMQGKYWWAFKPSDEGIKTAFNNGHLYYLDPWYNTDWNYRKLITINHNKVTGDLVDFPVCIDLASDSDLASLAQSDGDDILFTKSDGTTKLDHEIEEYVSATGELTAWVEVDSLSASTDTLLYMYFNNPTASNQENIAGTWDSDFHSVVHFDEDVDDDLQDSVNANIYVDYNDPDFDFDYASVIGEAVEYDGGDDCSKDSTPATLSDQDITIEIYLNQNDSDDRGSANNDNTVLYYHGDSKTGLLVCTDHEPAVYRITIKEDEAAADSAVVEVSRNLDQTYYLATTWDSSDNQADLYVDSVFTDTDDNDLVGTPDWDNIHAIGNVNTHTKGFNGIIDELRISKTIRSTDYINTTNYTLNDDAFFTLGDAESFSCPPITIEAEYPSNGATGVSLFPAVGEFSAIVNISDSNPTNVSAFTNESGTWTLMNWNETLSNGTFYFDNTSWVDTNGKKYWWSVNVTNSSQGCWYNETYSFTTYVIQVPPDILLGTENPANNSYEQPWWGNLLWNVTIVDTNGDSFYWQITSSPNIGWAQGFGEYDGSKSVNFGNLERGTTYTITVYATDPAPGSGEANTGIFYFTTKNNTSPIISGESPSNLSANIGVDPTTYVVVTDWEARHVHETTNVTWESNASGVWVKYGISNDVDNNTNISATYPNFSGYEKYYWWRVNASDGEGGTVSETYRFETEELPTGGNITSGGSNDRGYGGFLGLGGMFAIFGCCAFIFTVKKKRRRGNAR